MEIFTLSPSGRSWLPWQRRLSGGCRASEWPSSRTPAAPHFHGHRDRLRARFREQGAAALADYELLEMALFRAIPRGDTKPLAKALLKRFGTLSRGARRAAASA